MRKCAGIGLFVVGCALAGRAMLAQSFAAFDFRPQASVVVPSFSNTDISQLINTLDRLLTPAPVVGERVPEWLAQNQSPGWVLPRQLSTEAEADVVWQFARRLQAGELTSAQEARVMAHLDALVRARPDRDAIFAGPRRMIRDLTVGKPAPPITGTDLDGRTFSLADYRNNVVVLIFSAEWCGICRAQEPYERFLIDRYANWPVAVLGVETGKNRDSARRAQATDPRSNRTWWDAPRTGDSNGPIASAWNVIGWPATYLIDGDGVIRFVDVRDEDLLKAVRQLVEAQVDRDAAVRRK